MQRTTEIALAVATAALGAGLLAMAVPIAGASLAETRGSTILKRIHLESPDAPDLRRLIRSRESSLRWRAKGRTATDLALARMLLAEATGDAERAALLARAEDALSAGLGLAPMNPYGWIRLARLGMESRREAAEVAPALGLAIHTGPREDRLRVHVLEAGLWAWGALDARDRELVAVRARQAWDADPLGTAAAAARVGRTERLAGLLDLPAGRALHPRRR